MTCPDNDILYAFSRILLINSDLKQSDITRGNLAEMYCVDKWDSNTFPSIYPTVYKYQRKDKNLVEKLKCEN